MSLTPVSDPFIHHCVTIGWPDLLRGLLRRRIEVVVIVGGDSEIVEDVLELNDDYTGRHDSTRKADFRGQINDALFRLGREER